ncbi:MAG TPA: azurin [Steroidobacteraceae bacterium]|nr:azurin [Steroidobacteraceae bacterium]
MNSRHAWLAAALALAAGVPCAHPSVAHAADAVCKLQISGNDLMQFDKRDLTVPAGCAEIQVTLTHTGKLPAAALGHNWVLVKSSDLAAVANAGAAAGLVHNYLEPGDPRVIAATKVVGGGESTSVTFPVSKLVKGGSYMYLCTFPGHNALMRGNFHYY